MIDTVIFDFDGVIIDTETPDYETWREVFESHGVRLERSLWQRVIGGSATQFDPYEHLEDLAGMRLDRDSIEASRRQRYLARIESSPLLPGVSDYIQAATNLGLKLGVASSSTHAWVDKHLQERGLLPSLQCVVAREDVASVKPDPQLYTLAMKRLGTSPDRTVAIEDSLNGVTAAKRAGMFCVAVPNAMTHDLPLEEADVRLGALSEMGLETLLDTLVRGGLT